MESNTGKTDVAGRKIRQMKEIYRRFSAKMAVLQKKQKKLIRRIIERVEKMKIEKIRQSSRD